MKANSYNLLMNTSCMQCDILIWRFFYTFYFLSVGISSIQMYAFSYYYDRAVDLTLIGKNNNSFFFMQFTIL